MRCVADLVRPDQKSLLDRAEVVAADPVHRCFARQEPDHPRQLLGEHPRVEPVVVLGTQVEQRIIGDASG